MSDIKKIIPEIKEILQGVKMGKKQVVTISVEDMPPTNGNKWMGNSIVNSKGEILYENIGIRLKEKILKDIDIGIGYRNYE